jgi:hypothetical protein
MSDMFLSYVPSRSLRSSGTGLLTIPAWDQEAAFSYSAHSLLHSLPANLRGPNLGTYLKHIFSALLFLRGFYSISLYCYSLVFILWCLLCSKYLCFIYCFFIYMFFFPCEAHCDTSMSEMCCINKVWIDLIRAFWCMVGSPNICVVT